MINISMWIVWMPIKFMCCLDLLFLSSLCECVSILIEIFLSAHIKPTLLAVAGRRGEEKKLWRFPSSGAKGVVEPLKS